MSLVIAIGVTWLGAFVGLEGWPLLVLFPVALAGAVLSLGWLFDQPPYLPAPSPLDDFMAERREGSARFATHEELTAAGLVDEL